MAVSQPFCGKNRIVIASSLNNGFALSCPDLGDVAYDFVVLRAVGGDEYGGHTIDNQGDGTMFHLRSGQSSRLPTLGAAGEPG